MEYNIVLRKQQIYLYGPLRDNFLCYFGGNNRDPCYLADTITELIQNQYLNCEIPMSEEFCCCPEINGQTQNDNYRTQTLIMSTQQKVL